MLIGSYISGPLVDAHKTAAGHDWHSIWLIPAEIAAVVLVAFLLFFKDKPAAVSTEPVIV
jgi:sugar phosphate permease